MAVVRKVAGIIMGAGKVRFVRLVGCWFGGVGLSSGVSHC